MYYFFKMHFENNNFFILFLSIKESNVKYKHIVQYLYFEIKFSIQLLYPKLIK